MKRIRPDLILLIIGFVFLAVAYSILLSLCVARLGILKEADFSSFYTARRLADTGQYTHLYDIQAQLQRQEQLTGRSLQSDELLPFFHPPFFVPILQIICTPDYLASYWRRMLVMVCLLGVTAYLIDKLLQGIRVGGGPRFLTISVDDLSASIGLENGKTL